MDEYERRVLENWPAGRPYPYFSEPVCGNLAFDSGQYLLPDAPIKLGSKKLRDKWIEDCRTVILAEPSGHRRSGMIYALGAWLYYSNYTKLAEQAVQGL